MEKFGSGIRANILDPQHCLRHIFYLISSYYKSFNFKSSYILHLTKNIYLKRSIQYRIQLPDWYFARFDRYRILLHPHNIKQVGSYLLKQAMFKKRQNYWKRDIYRDTISSADKRLNWAASYCIWRIYMWNLRDFRQIHRPGDFCKTKSTSN
jgi:hypothetical protein